MENKRDKEKRDQVLRKERGKDAEVKRRDSQDKREKQYEQIHCIERKKDV